MKLSALLEMASGELERFQGRFYGVQCDNGYSLKVLSPPNGIQEISFVADIDDDPAVGLSIDFIDTVLAYVPIAKHVIIEIPFDMDLPPETAVAMANNFGTDLSILPPDQVGDGDMADALWEQYGRKLEEYAKVWLGKHNCSIAVLPVVGYFQYLIQRAVSDFEPKELSADPYMQALYVRGIPLDQSDRFKVQLKDVIYDAFGGEVAFLRFAHNVCTGVRTRLVNDVAEALKP